MLHLSLSAYFTLPYLITRDVSGFFDLCPVSRDGALPLHPIQIQSNPMLISPPPSRQMTTDMTYISLSPFLSPLDLTKVRLQASGDKRMIQSIRKTVRTAGVRGLFDGISGTWMRQMSYSLCRFWAYDESKKIVGAGEFFWRLFGFMSCEGCER